MDNLGSDSSAIPHDEHDRTREGNGPLIVESPPKTDSGETPSRPLNVRPPGQSSTDTSIRSSSQMHRGEPNSPSLTCRYPACNGKTFARSYDLLRHTLDFHKPPTWSCPFPSCTYSHCNKLDVELHCARYHPHDRFSSRSLPSSFQLNHELPPCNAEVPHRMNTGSFDMSLPPDTIKESARRNEERDGLQENRFELLREQAKLNEERDEIYAKRVELYKERQELLRERAKLNEELDEIYAKRAELYKTRVELFNEQYKLNKELDKLSEE